MKNIESPNIDKNKKVSFKMHIFRYVSILLTIIISLFCFIITAKDITQSIRSMSWKLTIGNITEINEVQTGELSGDGTSNGGGPLISYDETVTYIINGETFITMNRVATKDPAYIKIYYNPNDFQEIRFYSKYPRVLSLILIIGMIAVILLLIHSFATMKESNSDL